ncbi:OB-fold domain-containing protein [Streptomyces chlorus]|uniref:OB-fold domain-containing protein n=1 Tax=Streptomyces chlorus TaxID=887452 RepID=A0ABW1DTB9_9ACTN
MRCRKRLVRPAALGGPPPYIAAVVDLAERPRMMAKIVRRDGTERNGTAAGHRRRRRRTCGPGRTWR